MADTVVAEVIGKMGDLNLNQLLAVHAELPLPDIAEERRVKPHVMKLILRYLSSEDVETSEDGGLAHFLKIQTYISGLGIVKEEAEPITESTTEPTAIADLKTLKKVLKKDFKIRGVIGAPGKTGMLTFSS